MYRGIAAIELYNCVDCHYFASYPNKEVTYFKSIDDFADSEAIINWMYEYLKTGTNAYYYQHGTIGLFSLVEDTALMGGVTMEWARGDAKTYILGAYNRGLMTCVDDEGTFAPYQPLTRAEFCQILYRIGWIYKDMRNENYDVALFHE